MTFFIGGQVQAHAVVRLQTFMEEAKESRGEMVQVKHSVLLFWQKRFGKSRLAQRNAWHIFSYLLPYSERFTKIHRLDSLMNLGINNGEISVTKGGVLLDKIWPKWHLQEVTVEEAVKMVIEISRYFDLTAKRLSWYVDSVEQYKRQRGL